MSLSDLVFTLDSGKLWFMNTSLFIFHKYFPPGCSPSIIYVLTLSRATLNKAGCTVHRPLASTNRGYTELDCVDIV